MNEIVMETLIKDIRYGIRGLTKRPLSTAVAVLTLGTSNLPLSGTNMVFLASVEGSPNSSFPTGFRAVSQDYSNQIRPITPARCHS
jgi:hypothetical protein